MVSQSHKDSRVDQYEKWEGAYAKSSKIKVF